MLNKLATLFLLSVLMTVSVEAKEYYHKTKQLKGQKFYLKRCGSCHGSGKMGGNIYSTYEWDEIFKNQAKELAWLHGGEKGEKEIKQYIDSKEFKKESKYILKFIREFAYDSQYIPTCN